MEEKHHLRNIVKKSLHKIDDYTYHDWSHLISQRLFSHRLWKDTNTIGITISKRPEVDTIPIIEKAWKHNKKVVVPKCHPKKKKMTFREISSFDQLEMVYYGLQEPIEELTKETASHDIDLLIVPGLCFTKTGDRLGFGGGYYDRYLVNYIGNTVSLAFAIQIVQALPTESFDKRVQRILTNEEEIICNE
ncbi:5-formyltetrahydrofolate cyclo-ligase [Cytobacillus sp. IB215316]|uniref:5-formyltetrahydrofolate cyclo-ligase n=1 Tax=Cytobacillus sp. IB215316 TaxID=3097354 RepID=UPI002A0EDFAD|nr:5-formyltetrahydrofolate cyclo-ligase [Cytobacillus sp. IB215316]MDX8359589.1 5-formyltetrahydrofolate cyclo-ligase [Cytobacillus sp. IB215316]